MSLRLLKPRRWTTVGDLVAKAFERAEQLTSDHDEAARLATRLVERHLERTRSLVAARALALASAA